MTQPSHANPHRIFWHCFSRLSETLRKPLGNPRKPSQLQRKPGGNPPLNAFTHPLRPYKAFTLHRAFRFWAQTPRTVLEGGNTQPLSTLSGQDSLTRALKTSCHLELKIRWLGINPHHSLQVDTCGIRTHAGRPIGLAGRRVSSAKSASQLHSSPGSHVTVSLCFLCPPHLAISPALENNVHQPGIVPGSHRWQRCILPLDH